MPPVNFVVQQTTANGDIIVDKWACAMTRPDQSFGYVMRKICEIKRWEPQRSYAVFGDYDYIWRGTIVHEFAPNGDKVLLSQFQIADGEVLRITMQRKWINNTF